MFTFGEYRDKDGIYSIVVSKSKLNIEVMLVVNNEVKSAFKHDEEGDWTFLSKKAREAQEFLIKGFKACTSKNGTAVPFKGFGTSILHNFIKTKVEYEIEKFNGELVGAEIKSADKYLKLTYLDKYTMPEIPYVKVTTSRKTKDADIEWDDNNVVTRSVAEIAMEKENLEWLQNKKYYIVNNEDDAERLFTQLEHYNGPIAYDTETTGLKINCFGQIGSTYEKDLKEWNDTHPDDQIRADRMVGIIFCVEKDVSYYFPAFNRKFKNLYEDANNPHRQRIVDQILARYTIGDLRDTDLPMANYIRNTPKTEWRNDVILMERVRNILEKGHIVGHNGTFDWKVGWQYSIDTNFKDDTMILHQLMYKFRSTTSNSGESSALKSLEAREFGMYAWELEDFFPDYKPDRTGLVRKKPGAKNNATNTIDFSYMDYDGTRIYAPTDGDATFQLFTKYKTDLVTNHKDLEYLYQVEMIVSVCVGYMEFYGHRIDERMINNARDNTKAEVRCLKSEIRQLVGYSSEKEIELYNKLVELRKQYEKIEDSFSEEADKTIQEMNTVGDSLNDIVENDESHPLNLAAPGQVANLFYNVLNIPMPGDKPTVAKRELKALLKMRNEDGTPKYPIVHKYSDYKKLDTLLVKFFDNLNYYQYPGGYIFSSFGQISTATGRMTASKPRRALGLSMVTC